jgi:hypothetical protein
MQAGFTMRELIILLTCLVALLPEQRTSATEWGYQLTGTVTQSFAMPYGKNIPVGTSVTLQFVYEDARPVTHSNFNCDCLGYQQNHLNGLWAQFGATGVRADSFIIQVANNLTAFGQSAFDAVTVSFDSSLVPQLAEPLLVDGAAYETGLLSFTLTADEHLFDTPELPPGLATNRFRFPANFNQLDQQPGGATQVLYSVESIGPIDVLSSDHDLDSDVDGRDFLIWQRNYGLESQNGDSNSNGFVDHVDLSDWQLHYGDVSITLGEVNAIPEPSSSLLSLVTLLIISICCDSRSVRCRMRIGKCSQELNGVWRPVAVRLRS